LSWWAGNRNCMVLILLFPTVSRKHPLIFQVLCIPASPSQ
jgi:hypothetical protein